MRGSRVRFASLGVIVLGVAAASRVRVAAEDPARAAESTRRCVVTGRVLDGWRNGVVDAAVAWIGDAPRGDESIGRAVRTDGEGRYRLELYGPTGRAMQGVVHATQGARAALQLIVVGTAEEERQLAPLQLRSAQPLHVEVRREGAPVPNATVWLWANDIRGLRRIVFLGTATSDAKGRAAFAPLPSALLRLHARTSDGFVGDEIEDVEPGSEPVRTTVALVASRVVDLLVTTDDSSPVPVAGATVLRRLHVYSSDVVQSVDVQVPA